MGGGLSGLTAGIALAEAGKNVALVSAGQSTLHFGSGSLDLLGTDNKGNDVCSPIEAITNINPKHPYSKLENVSRLAEVAKMVLERAGIATTGNATGNHWRISPVGALMPTWLSLEGMATIDDPDHMPWKRVALVNVVNYLGALTSDVNYYNNTRVTDNVDASKYRSDVTIGGNTIPYGEASYQQWKQAHINDPATTVTVTTRWHWHQVSIWS